MDRISLSSKIQSAQSYLSEALETLTELSDELNELEEKNKQSQISALDLSHIERAQSLTASALQSIDRIRIR